MITALSSLYGNKKYYLNESNLVYKFERSNSSDTSFNSIREQITYTFNASGALLDAKVTFSDSSAQTWRWVYDPIDFTVKQFVNGDLQSTVKLNLDSCFIEVVYLNQQFDSKSVYYLDSDSRCYKIKDYYNTKKELKSSTIYYDWNSNDQVARQYGTDYIKGKIDTQFNFDVHGFKTKEELPILRKVITYHYFFN